MTNRTLWGLALVLIIAGVAVAGAAGEFSLKLTVEEPAGVARKAAWARGGVPLMKGQFKKGQPFAVFADGAEVPAQVLPLVVDEKGFLRWILVDLLTDLGAKEKKAFVLKATRPAAKPAAPIKVTDGADAVTVDTGRIALVVSKKKPFALFDSVTVGGTRVAGGGYTTYTDGTLPDREKWRPCTAGPPENVELEHAGPLRVTVRAAGRFPADGESKLRYIARITAWAGRSDVLVKYSLANSNPDQFTYRRIADSSIVFELPGQATGSVLGADKPIEAAAHARITQGLLRRYHRYGRVRAIPGAAKAWSEGKEVWAMKSHDDHPLGWILVKGEAGNVFVCDRYFWENPARQLAGTGNALVLTGVTERWDGPKHTFFKGTKNERQVQVGHPHRSKVRWLLDSNHLSSEYVIDFAPPTDHDALVAAANAARRIPHVMAPPAWYFETESLCAGKFGTQEDEVKCYDTWGWKRKGTGPKNPKLNHYYGTVYARWTKGTDNHYESEADVLEMLTLMYLRTGGRGYFDKAQAWANHGMDTRLFRTDGWRFKDGGVWWTKSGPAGGNTPQRPADPVTGFRQYLQPPWSVGFINKKTGVRWGAADGQTIGILADSRQCYCHSYGAGMAAWACITGDGDALQAAIDSAEQVYDDQSRATYHTKVPGRSNSFSRDFTRASRILHAVRLAAPADPFIVKASDFIAAVYLKRPRPEPRGFVNPAGLPVKPKKAVNVGAVMKNLERHAGKNGMAEMKRLGVTVDPETGALMDQAGHKWRPLATPHTFMYPQLYRAMDTYRRITGSEDAQDWLIAIGKAFAEVAYQPHGNFAHYSVGLADFPVRGVFRDRMSWAIQGTDNKYGEGMEMGGYISRKWPDACARAYSLCGEPLLKQRALDYWFAGTHRAYRSKKMHNLGSVGMWVNFYNVRDDHVGFNGHTFYIHSHPRKDQQPPGPVRDLEVRVDADKAYVSFTAPADAAGKVARYQVKWSDKPIVDYDEFLKHWAAFTDDTVTNWWMAVNLKAEPAPRAASAKESFVLTGVPNVAKYFAVRSFDDSSNRSAISNVARAK